MAHPQPPKKQGPNGEKYLCVGIILGAHGIRGALRAKSFTENPQDIAAYGPLSSQQNQIFTIQKVRQGARATVILDVAEITDRTTAEQLLQTYLYAPKSAIPTAENEVLYDDLLGKKAVYESGETGGKITQIFSNTAQEVLEINPIEGTPFLVPFVDEYIQKIEENQVILSEHAKLLQALAADTSPADDA